MGSLSPEASEKIQRILDADSDNFVNLVRVAGLDPAKDFRHKRLHRVDFKDCDLAGFDFVGARFEHCSFVGARIAGAVFDDASFLASDPRQAVDWLRRSPLTLARARVETMWLRCLENWSELRSRRKLARHRRLIVERATQMGRAGLPNPDDPQPTAIELDIRNIHIRMRDELIERARRQLYWAHARLEAMAHHQGYLERDGIRTKVRERLVEILGTAATDLPALAGDRVRAESALNAFTAVHMVEYQPTYRSALALAATILVVMTAEVLINAQLFASQLGYLPAALMALGIGGAIVANGIVSGFAWARMRRPARAPGGLSILSVALGVAAFLLLSVAHYHSALVHDGVDPIAAAQASMLAAPFAPFGDVALLVCILLNMAAFVLVAFNSVATFEYFDLKRLQRTVTRTKVRFEAARERALGDCSSARDEALRLLDAQLARSAADLTEAQLVIEECNGIRATLGAQLTKVSQSLVAWEQEYREAVAMVHPQRGRLKRFTAPPEGLKPVELGCDLVEGTVKQALTRCLASAREALPEMMEEIIASANVTMEKIGETALLARQIAYGNRGRMLPTGDLLRGGLPVPAHARGNVAVAGTSLVPRLVRVRDAMPAMAREIGTVAQAAIAEVDEMAAEAEKGHGSAQVLRFPTVLGRQSVARVEAAPSRAITHAALAARLGMLRDAMATMSDEIGAAANVAISQGDVALRLYAPLPRQPRLFRSLLGIDPIKLRRSVKRWCRDDLMDGMRIWGAAASVTLPILALMIGGFGFLNAVASLAGLRADRDPATLCVADTSPPRAELTLLDTTDRLAADSGTQLEWLLRRIGDDLPRGGRLTIVPLNGDLGRPAEPAFDACSPGRRSEANSLLEGGARLQRDYDQRFEKPLEAVVRKISRDRPSTRSPIAAQIVRTVTDPVIDWKGDKRVLNIVTDGLENGRGSSAYGSGPVRLPQAPPELLRGVTVNYYELTNSSRHKLQTSEVRNAWKTWLEEAGGTVNMYAPGYPPPV